MGRMGAIGMADSVREGVTELRIALGWHLTSNHYPPLPMSLVPAALRAINKANKEQWHTKVLMPKNLLFRGKRLAPIEALIEALHLEDFIDPEVRGYE